MQSLCVVFALMFSTLFIFPGSLSADLKHKVQSKFADGYSLISWANSLLPNNATILITQRSTFLFNNTYVNPEPLGFMSYESSYKNFYLNKIKEKKPKFVIFNGDQNSSGENPRGRDLVGTSQHDVRRARWCGVRRALVHVGSIFFACGEKRIQIADFQ